MSRPVSGVIDLGAFEFASAAPLQIITEELPDTIRHMRYWQDMAAAGGSGTYVWTVSEGTLPPGLYLDPATGHIRGRVRLKGSWTFTLSAADAGNPTSSGNRQFTITSKLYR